MSHVLRLLVGGITSLGLALTFLIGAPATANASEVNGVTLTSNEWKAARLAAKARNYAITAGGSKMNYRKLKAVFGTKNATRVSWRRQMAAGFRQAGGKIVYISKAENKKVEAVRKKIYGRKKPRAGAFLTAYASPCRGRSGTVVKGNYTTRYLNSCETIDLIWAWGGCAATMGVIASFAGGEKRVSWPVYAVGAFCGYWATLIGREREKSDYKAVIIRTYKQEAYQPYPGQVRYFIKTSVYAQ